MGLDMYLTRKRYIGAHWPHRKVTGSIDIQIDGQPVEVEFDKVNTIEEHAGYWRKANAIHRWFVENCAGGVDNCQEVYVSKKQMQELLETVNQVLAASKLKKGKVYDGASLTAEATKEILEENLQEKYNDCEFYYRASW